MPFTVHIERDVRDAETGFTWGLDPLLDDPAIEVEFLADDRGPTIEPDDLRGADAFISYSYQLTAASLEGVEDLRIVTRGGAGYDNLDLEALTDHGVVVAHAPQGPTASVAESTVAMIIACAHNLPRHEHRLRREGWRGEVSDFGFELSSATVGFVGMGLIGQAVLENLEPYRDAGLDVRVYDPYMSDDRAAALGVERVDLDAVLETADVITIHVPLTDETHHMLDADSFRSMKETASLVNTSRGGIYPDEDLAAAIREGEIAGAAIDVFENEPDVADNPLLEIEDVMLTPHVSGVTTDSMARIGNLMAESIINVKNGEPPINVLNPDAYEDRFGEPLPADSLSPSFRS